MNILSIGNSFSQDAQRYLHQLAKANGTSITAVNLYIGGCPLGEHYINMLNDSKNYAFEYNGESVGLYVSIREALSSRSWDIVTLQQASHESFRYSDFQPYLDELCRYVKKYAPKSKLYMHQTWAYKDESTLLYDRTPYKTHSEMFADIKKAYFEAAKAIDAYGIIPSGELVNALNNCGISNVQRDAAHVSLGLGRYALALLWCTVLTGADISDNSFDAFDEPVSFEDRELAKRCVKEVISQYSINR